MTAYMRFASLLKQGIYPIAILLLVSVIVVSCDDQGTSTVGTKDSTTAASDDSGVHKGLAVPHTYILYADWKTMDSIVNIQPTGKGEKIVFQFCHTGSGMTLAAFPGKLGHKFDAGVTFTLLGLGTRVEVAGITDPVVLGDMEITSKRDNNTGVKFIQELLKTHPVIRFYFTPVMNTSLPNGKNHLVYKIAYDTSKCFQDKEFNLQCYKNSKQELMTLNPVPPGNADE